MLSSPILVPLAKKEQEFRLGVMTTEWSILVASEIFSLIPFVEDARVGESQRTAGSVAVEERRISQNDGSILCLIGNAC